MLATPQLQAAEMRSFAAGQKEKETQQESAAAKQDTLAGARQALAQSNWDPHRDPLAAPAAPAPGPQLRGLAGAVQASGVITSTDTDGDGLNDADEASWHTCPSVASSSAYCSGVADPKDTDGDTLTDGAEVNALGTLPGETDTDSDSIPDNLEVKGFAYQGRTWYLDPTNSDSNRDGSVDSSECPVWSVVTPGTYNPNAICPDTDSDGTPNLFDDDNDGDSVHDNVDLSPDTLTGTVYGGNSPLALSISNLETNRPVLIDIQLRPTDPAHIQQLGNVLDWPSGDSEGQIQRRKTTTFASTVNSSAKASDSRAANGDIRLVPMLEVTIPYAAGHYGNLPVKAAYQGTTRSLSTPLSDWLDTGETDPYGISVRQEDAASGDLTMLVPLTTVAGETGDTATAFSTQLLYWPSQGSGGRATWGSAQQLRVVWLVQMLTDECIDAAADPDTCARQDAMTVIHTYDDDWRLTGMQVSEEHGLDVGIVYENPAAGRDDNLSRDDELWMASWYLSNTFLTGIDCDTKVNNVCQGDGERDVSVSTLRSELDQWTNNSNYLGVRTFGTYDHSGYISTVMMTGTKQLLNEVFTPFAGKTNPTLLFAQEKTQRQLSLDYATIGGGAVSFNLDPASVGASTRALLSWSPYAYVNNTWQNMDVEDYATALSANLAQTSFFQAADSSQESADVAEGKRTWAQLYYIALSKGSVGVVEADGDSTWTYNGEELYEYTPAWDNRPSFKGANYVAGMYGSSIGAALYTKMANAWGRYFSGVTTPNTTFWKQFKTSFSIYKSKYTVVSAIHSNNGRLINGTVAVLTVVAASAVLLYGYGMMTGDQQALSVASYALNGLSVMMTAGYIVTMVRTAYKAYKAGLSMTKVLKFTKSSLSIGTAVTALIFLAATWGPLIAQISSGQLSGIAMEYAIAGTVAATIVFVVFTILGSLPIVGLILQLFYLVDLILSLLNIRGMQDRVTEWLASKIFTVESVITNFDDSSRMDFDITDASLTSPGAGYVRSNAVKITVAVTTTLKHEDPIHTFIFGPFASMAAKKTTLRYYLQRGEYDRHGEFGLDGSTSDWTTPGDDQIRMKKTLTSVHTFAGMGTGLNRTLDKELYLTEAYSLPILTCWFFVGCDWDNQEGSNHINLGDNFVYDILPDTLDGFIAMDWNNNAALALPAQKDLDGDGLRLTSGGGADPDDTDPDSDDDGLSDYDEFIRGTELTSADSDGDGLSDRRELFASTDPLSRDSDGDGLSDYVELEQGWLVGYTAADGSAATTRVWSDPTGIDGDEDSLVDLKEFAFGLNPSVPDDPSLIENLIQFSDMTVRETASPALLLELDESATTTAFADTSGRGVTVSCSATAGTCPAAGASGHDGGALSFDGSDDYVPLTRLVSDDFTIAFWLKTTQATSAATQWWQGKGLVDAEVGGFANDFGVALGDGGKVLFGVGNASGADTTIKGGSVANGAWHHVAAVRAKASGAMTLYVDGVQVASGTGNTLGLTSPSAMRLGMLQTGLNPYAGALDKLAIYGRALAAAEVGAVMRGRIDANDLIVAPGAAITYQSTISNTHQTVAANGLLTAQTEYIAPAVPQPNVALRFEAEDRLTTYSNSARQSGAATCVSAQCPSMTWINGNDRAALFNGVDDKLSFGRFHTISGAGGAGWLTFQLKITSLPAAGQTAQIFETEAQGGALSLYLNSSGKLVTRWQGSGSSTYQILNAGGSVQQSTAYNGFSEHASTRTFSASSGWIDVALWYYLNPGGSGNSTSHTEFKFNGASDSRVFYTTVPSQILIGPGALGNNAAGSAPLSAALNNFAAGFISLSFNEDQYYDFTSFTNAGNYGDSGPAVVSCASAASCPAYAWTGQNGEAVTFDGTDDYLPLSQSLTFTDNDTGTISFWLKLGAVPAAGQRAYVIDNSCAASQRCFDVYFDSLGRLNFDLITNGVAHNLRSDYMLNGSIGVWKKATLTWNVGASGQAANRSMNVDGIVNTTTSQTGSTIPLVFNPGGGRLGQALDGSGRFAGMLDDVTMTGVVDGATRTIYSLGFNEPAFDVAQLNRVSGGRGAACASYAECPATTGGVFGSALSFDGADDRLTATYETKQGEHTVAAWVKFDTIKAQNIVAFTTASNTFFPAYQLVLRSDGRFSHLGVSSTTVAQPNTWYHVAAVLGKDRKARLYVNGEEQGNPATASTLPSGSGYVYSIGAATSGNAALDGALDELIISSSGTGAAGVRALMAAPYPAITLATAFETAAIAPRGSATVAGSASVNPLAASGTHRLRQEASAAVDMSAIDSYPVADPNASNLVIFLPLDQTPGSATFANLGQHAQSAGHLTATCSGASCPATGLRGKSDRAAYFDGLDDTVSFPGTDQTELAYQTIAAWVKADSEGGTIAGSSSSYIPQIQLTTNSFAVGSLELPFDITDNVWTHVVGTYNRSTGAAAVYVNGALAGSGTASGGVTAFWPMIGSTGTSNNVLDGYLDDVRIYMNVLSAAQVQTLYQQSAPVVQFAFDEESDATVFNDSSANGYVGFPSSEICNTVTITSATVTRFAHPNRGFELRLGSTDELLFQVLFPANGSSYPVNASARICGSDTLRYEVRNEDHDRVLVEAHALDASLSGPVHDSTATEDVSHIFGADYSWSTPQTIYNPLPGNDGRIGNTALFATEGSIRVPGATAVGNLTNGFTVIGWIKPDSLLGAQTIIGSGVDLSRNGFSFGLLNGKLRLNGFDRGAYGSNVGVAADTWQQVAVVFDSANKATFYLDGSPKQSMQGTAALAANSDDPLYIGNHVTEVGQLTDFFIGQLDELTVYPRALGAAELYSIYLRELRWFSDVAGSYLKVDAQNPTVELLSGYAYRATGYTQLAVQTSDDSYVQSLEFGLKGPAMSDYVWTQAPVCDETGASGALWCPSFDSTALGGAGAYALQFRATDAVGHETTSAVSTIYVDGAGPVGASAYAGGFQDMAAEGGDDLSWSVTLSGSISDPTVGAVAGSGIYTPTAEIALYDARGEIAGTGAAQPAMVSGGTWTVDYRFAGAQPSGTYTVKLTAEDAVGNKATTTVGSISADERPASLDIELAAIGESRLISETAALGGVVSEQANWGGEAVRYHFEDSAGASFDDSGVLDQDAACAASCPARVSGLFGQALRFGAGASLTVPATTALDLQAATLSAWIRPTWTAGAAGYNPAIMALRDAGGTRFSLHLRDNYSALELYNGSTTGSAPVSITPGQWTHIAVAQRGGEWTAYVNGVAAGTVAQAFGPATGRPLQIGSSTGAADRFLGDIDEPALYGRALSAEEIYALGRANLAGVDRAQIRLEPARLTDPISDTVIDLRFEDPGAQSFANAAGATLPAVCASCPAAVDGLFGQALSFDGVDDALSLTAGLTLTQFTVAAWVKPDFAGDGGYDILGDAAADPAARAPRLSLFEQGKVRAGFGDGGEWLELTTVGPAVANGAWSHVAASYDGVNFNIYVNGELIITSDGYQGRVPAPASGLLIGGADSRWRGALDEVRLYGRALPPAEMALLASRAGASSWQNAALSRSTSLASAWSYALPADTEGYYLLHARASDDAANVGEPTTAWRGIIDTKAPVITATAALYGSAPVSRTVYTIATTDRF
ncbi:MAG TPA: LamG-like jellyroll fold domain-containing protein, partial [Herpetosiphonaceae bacterium]